VISAKYIHSGGVEVWFNLDEDLE